MHTAPHRCIGHSPYASLRAVHPPRPVEYDDTAKVTGSERVIAWSMLAVSACVGVLVGYVLARLNVLLPMFAWIDGLA